MSDILVRFNLQVQIMRSQGYDGANNMRGAWYGLQALFLRDCPYAYYVHYFAQRLQLTLVSAVRDVADINSFFSDLNNSSIDMYAATCKVLEYLSNHSPNNVGNHRCALSSPSEKKTQDSLTAMRFVHTIKTIIQELREDRWEEFLEEVNYFCSKNDTYIPDFHGSYMVGRSHGREYPTIEHHYHFDIFNAAIDFVMTELDTRFNETSLELVSLGGIGSENSFESFNIDNICKLTEKFYPPDFT
ncbi:uncharacterized protein LOC111392271 [Olea europaea var. sylvestris]|uniref:uncharacterized protein LOC111392271 n=1 Tax=Olea europaea var. sylvestris TaxID=158386 RepID=UPI000C1CF296|nr:uncharacterized protein LOC111392271 [Olea europaea var. sylvestris]